MIGIGIDTGGTYTDAVVYDMDKKRVLSAGKALTTKAHLETGIAAALDTLDPAWVARAEMLSLSTTLATNACVEDKGSRAKLLFIGVDENSRDRLKDVYASYGFRNPEQLVFLDGKPEGIYDTPEEPDWDTFRQRIPADFSDCGAVGVVQIYPRSNGARFEKQAKKILMEERKIPVTTASEMFDETDVLKRGAGTLLNARLIPLIDEFLKAVRLVMEERGLDLPVTVVRSDGSMMAETLARECPVETLLSGPAASAVGGSVLAGEKDAVIVDMGGTTTDIALVQGERPVMAEQGIYIGKWKTMVRGMYVDTFVLGGDCAVRFQKGKLFLDNRRVIPVSLLAKEYPQVTEKLQRLSEWKKTHTRMLHEFCVLQKEIAGKNGYTREEQELCAALRNGPLLLEELAAALRTSIYTMPTERLEDEGILMKSGLTPTDMMVVKGDFTAYRPEAALTAMEFIALNVDMEPEELPDAVYDLVEKKMYCGIARVLLEREHPRRGGWEDAGELIEWAYEDAKRIHGRKSAGGAAAGKPGTAGVSAAAIMSAETAAAAGAPTFAAAVGVPISAAAAGAPTFAAATGVPISAAATGWAALRITTDLPLVGVGAPIHIFLPRVAKLLGTRAVIRENAAVANALGAIAGQIAVKVQIRVKAEYKAALLQGYSVYEDIHRHMFEKYSDAETFAVETARKQVYEKALRQGASENARIQVTVKKIRNQTEGAAILFESVVEAVASDSFQGRLIAPSAVP